MYLSSFGDRLLISHTARDSISLHGDTCSPPLPDEAQPNSNLDGFKRQADGQSNLTRQAMVRTKAHERQRADALMGKKGNRRSRQQEERQFD